MTSKKEAKPTAKAEQEAQAAKPVKEALKAAVKEVYTEAQAEAAVDQLEAKAGTQTVESALQAEPPKRHAAQAAREVESARRTAPSGQKTAEILVETARAVETTHGPAQEALAQATQAALAPEQTSEPEPAELTRRRDLLRMALLRRLKPLQALDADLFIRVNHLPHTPFSNGFFHFITMAFHGGAAWYLLVAGAMLAQGKWDKRLWQQTVIPLTAASAVVEGPIKGYFKRKRPFIDLVRAVVIGRKPGTWSFPSGHAATGFAGAYLLSRQFPRLRAFFYGAASLVAFSRVYLGVHYPGDVVTGSVAGHTLAQIFAWVYKRVRRLRRQR
jgi:undecaprenyl-diphosphatase